jgi:glycerophosphoryl diester phosphodiesterase
MRLSKVQVVITFIGFLIGIPAAAEPIVIAHRGASGYLPEHTLAAYRLAIEMGADYIEPDLVFSKDGVLVVRHDNYLSTTTDVEDHPEFAARKRKLAEREDWFVEDFTLQELKTLRARQAFKGRSKEFDGNYQIPTFQEVIDLATRESARLGRQVGLYPETKLASHYDGLGYDFAGSLLESLKKNNLNKQSSQVFIQSFEPDILRRLNQLTDVRLIQLVVPLRGTDGEMQSGIPNVPLEKIVKYADGVGALKYLLISPEGKPTAFVGQVKALGLELHAWTFRDDAYSSELFETAELELTFYLELGIDGFFTDFPDTGVRVRSEVAISP